MKNRYTAAQQIEWLSILQTAVHDYALAMRRAAAFGAMLAECDHPPTSNSDHPPTSNCICPSFDAWECAEMRYGCNSYKQECECACHTEYEEWAYGDD